MAQKITGGKLTFQNPILGGISDTKYLGRANSFHHIVGLDINSQPGLMTVSRALKEETTVNERCHYSVFTTAGTFFIFSYTSGKIWKRDVNTGATVLVHTTVPTLNDPGCRGALEYNGYIYWASEYYLHRIPVNNAHLEPWSTGLVQNWQALNGNQHFMLETNNVLYICTGNTVSQVDNVTFTADKLRLPYAYSAGCLAKSGTDLVVAGNYANESKQAVVYVWNTFSKSFSFSDEIDEGSIGAMIEFDNTTLIFPHKSANVYYLNGSRAERYMKLPKSFWYYPNMSIEYSSLCVYRNVLYMGVTDYTGSSTGIFTLSAYSPEYRKVVALQYPLANKSATTSFPTLSGSIYSLKIIDSSNWIKFIATCAYTVAGATQYCVNATDPNYLNAKAYIDTKVIIPSDYDMSRLRYAWADYDSIPTGTDVDMMISKDGGSYGDGTTAGAMLPKTIDTMRKIITFDLASAEVRSFQLRLVLSTTANQTPQVQQFGVKID